MHNYMKKLYAMADRGELDGDPATVLTDVRIYHDLWCAIFENEYCNCDPQIKIFNMPAGQVH